MESELYSPLFVIVADGAIFCRTVSTVRAQATDDNPNALALAALSNATYRSAYADGDEITLVNGLAATADEAQIMLTGYIAYGDSVLGLLARRRPIALPGGAPLNNWPSSLKALRIRP